METTVLESALRGHVITPGDTAYDEARSVYNAMIDKRPAAIARCSSVADVIAAVNYGRDAGLRVAVRGGGHSGPGFGLCDGGLVIDLSGMRGIRVDPKARTAWVQGGCTWGDVDHATHAFGLAVPSGIIASTGVGGLTLGGGHGYLSRQHGLTIDNLLEAEVVLADGSYVTASATEHADLFWALRGGGGNFGVVTGFTFRLHPVGTVHGGPMFWPLEQADEVMRWYRAFLREAPRELSGWLGFHVVPPAPPFPEDIHLRKVCAITWCHTGPAEAAEAAFAAVRRVGTPILDLVGPLPYPALQSMFDGLYTPGLQWYWKGDFVRELDDDAIALHLEHAARLPSVHSTMHLYPIDGAVHDVAEDATAWAYRDVTWSSVTAGVDPDPANAERVSTWAREYWQALHPHSAGGAYVNFMMEEGDDRLRATYRGNYDRLVDVKTAYDPHNLFRINQNIVPRGG